MYRNAPSTISYFQVFNKFDLSCSYVHKIPTEYLLLHIWWSPMSGIQLAILLLPWLHGPGMLTRLAFKHLYFNFSLKGRNLAMNHIVFNQFLSSHLLKMLTSFIHLFKHFSIFSWTTVGKTNYPIRELATTLLKPKVAYQIKYKFYKQVLEKQTLQSLKIFVTKSQEYTYYIDKKNIIQFSDATLELS